MSDATRLPSRSTSGYTIGKVAGLVGLSVHALRFYEKEGLLRLRRRGSGRYRSYDEADLRRLHFIRSAQECGFPLDEIRILLALPEQTGACCADVRSLALQKKLQLEARIRSMQKMSQALDRLIRDCSGSSATLSACPILQGLRDEDGAGRLS